MDTSILWESFEAHKKALECGAAYLALDNSSLLSEKGDLDNKFSDGWHQ